MDSGTTSCASREGANATLSVIVPAHQVGRKLDRCVHALDASLDPEDELIVVFDGIRAPAPGGATRTIELDEPSGPAAARNAGAAVATGDVLLFIDSDVEVLADTISSVRSAFMGNSILDALIGSYDDAPADRTVLSRYRNLLHHYTHQNSSRDARTFWGACGAIRRHVFSSVGGFDERFETPSVEDIELGYRLHGAGFRIELRKDIQVKHLKEWRAGDLLRTDVFRRAAPWTKLLIGQRGLPSDLNLQWEHRISIVNAYILLFSLIVLIVNSSFTVVALICAGFHVFLNRSFYNFLRGRMVISGVVQAVFWHWVFYLCAGAGALFGAVQFVLANRHQDRGEESSVNRTEKDN